MMSNQKQPTIQALILLHSIDERHFEVMQIVFPHIDTKELEAEFEKEKAISETSNRFKQIVSELCSIDSLMDSATMDLGNNGNVSEDIHEELWSKEKKEHYYCINVDLFYSESRDYFGEIDIDVDYEYEVSSIEKEWDKLDLLQKDTKIYSIDYEDSKCSYTVIGVSELTDADTWQKRLCYDIHSDQLNTGRGFSLPIDVIDKSDITGRFYSSPELAHEAYVRFQEYLNNREIETEISDAEVDCDDIEQE